MTNQKRPRMRTEKTFARLLPFEKALLVGLQKQERMNESEALRLAIREAARARGLWPETKRKEEAAA